MSSCAQDTSEVPAQSETKETTFKQIIDEENSEPTHEPEPARFTVSDLLIILQKVPAGSSVTIEVLVTNIGELIGTYDVVLKLDEMIEATEKVILAGGDTQKVSFATIKFTAKTYAVMINGQYGTFTVQSLHPPVSRPSEEQLSTPTFSPPGAGYKNGQMVTINTPTAGAQIFYTVDGTNPSVNSFQYMTPLEIYKAGTTSVKAIVVKNGYEQSQVATAEYVIDNGNAPLGEIGGLHYVYWDFGINNIRSIEIKITICDEPDNQDGLYFQMYQGQINGVGFYFGIQTDIYKPDIGSTGKGIIFSRWGTRDISNVRTVAGGWSQTAGYEGNFVGIRKNYEWTTHGYQLKISYTETDEEGDWYGVWIRDLNDSTEDFLGSVRFPKSTPENSGIQNGGITWTELYDKKVSNTPLPTWHVSVDSIEALDCDGVKYLPKSAVSDYSKIANTDIYYDKATKRIHFIMGYHVHRIHGAGRLY